ncbi:related to triose phosphate/3-phosphoglycerate/phosphate translocator [Rhynchosporium agropyri]|uniref:Related to triose phosphate/3-phosphoglycerate/phosphate translocator n=3 Tax=Rhynchosporium TaxID=38037 RepID=A0A1E1MU79_RHYSE|nr:related to triose phosphate/3-phosphoglycerate/phosphate translocator [Rhynchosporium commune]CZT06926.1 related to triose phosphate/3-phosphoglycerate/phosphate translocator [Rhynchosporium agropyri]CZT52640.1 related to triose phosphate/3-phosphoglycerate/phosphate translocator [Rhynchosporium secalis]
MSEEKVRISGEAPRTAAVSILPTVNPDAEKSAAPAASNGIHPALYVAVWISLSSSVILFNKWILSTLGFAYPILLTSWHLIFATIMTQIMARTTTLLDGRKTVKMTGKVYLRAIVPIGVFFSLSLICGNLTYLYLSVSFIQMLKAFTPVAVLVAGWILQMHPVDLKKLGNVSFIVIGVALASFGEIDFVLTGFLYQIGGIAFEAVRICMVERLLNGAEFKMDPLVSLYYFAPVCGIMNFTIALFLEIPKVQMSEVYAVGLWTFFANASCAFFLNMSVVFLIGKTSGLVLTLCGVLKDILLVAASMLIWGTQVSSLQAFGYTIALCGMVYYKLGQKELKPFISECTRRWAEFGANKPILRKLVIFSTFIVTVFLLLGGLAPYAPADYDPKAYLAAAKNSLGTS